MKFLIDGLDGETIKADLVDDIGAAYVDDDILYVAFTACRLSTARSLEAEAVKEATELFVDIMKHNDIAGGAESILDWLKKWAM